MKTSVRLGPPRKPAVMGLPARVTRNTAPQQSVDSVSPAEYLQSTAVSSITYIIGASQLSRAIFRLVKTVTPLEPFPFNNNRQNTRWDSSARTWPRLAWLAPQLLLILRQPRLFVVPLPKDDPPWSSEHLKKTNCLDNPVMSDLCTKRIPLSKIRPELRDDEAALVIAFNRALWSGL
jgi:hypothetical protein